jgi:hypothetical protein
MLVLCKIVKESTGLPNVIANMIGQYDDTRRPYDVDSFDFLMELADILKGYLFGFNPDPKKVRKKLKQIHKTAWFLNIKNHGEHSIEIQYNRFVLTMNPVCNFTLVFTPTRNPLGSYREDILKRLRFSYFTEQQIDELVAQWSKNIQTELDEDAIYREEHPGHQWD